MLKKFGKVVLDYFLINYPNTYSFKLSVDDYTFSEFALMSGFEEDKIIRLIQSKDTYCNDDLEAIAIAAYQVKIVGDVDSVMSSGSDSYYQKIKDNYSSYRLSDNNSICNGYFSNQINLWRRVRNLFQKNGRNLEIPDDHPGAGRYVQYPVKSHEMKNSDLLRWADKFRNRGLKPQDINISYQYFCSLFFPNSRNESYKRTIFNFYKIWDGRSYADILNKKPKTNVLKDSNSVDTKIVLDYLDSRIAFFDQETGEKITDLNTLKSLFYTSSNKVFFVQNEEDDFYSPLKNKIKYGLDFILLSKEDLNLSESFMENKFIQNFEDDQLYVYFINFSKDVCVKLHIETAQKPPLELVGGLKKSRNCYYRFGLPVIEFSQPQKVMYINSDIVQIDSNRVVLSKLSCLEPIIKKGGSVAIRLADYLPINFTVEDIDSERRNPDEVGWEFYSLRYISSNIAKEEETKKGTVIGFDSTIEFKPLKNTNSKIDNRRTFIIRNEYLENRFSKRKDF